MKYQFEFRHRLTFRLSEAAVAKTKTHIAKQYDVGAKARTKTKV